jgi:hypothetical protein
VIKSYRHSFLFQLLILDGLVSALAWYFAYYVRFEILSNGTDPLTVGRGKCPQTQWGKNGVEERER